jgi:hypothetical protein
MVDINHVILTRNGYKKGSEINSDDQIWDGISKFRTLDPIITEEQDCLQITFQNSNYHSTISLICSSLTLFYIKNSNQYFNRQSLKCSANQLQINDYLANYVLPIANSDHILFNEYQLRIVKIEKMETPRPIIRFTPHNTTFISNQILMG